jgi:2-methylcitrate dehydratase
LEYSDLDEATVTRVENRIIDSLACAFAAFDEAPVSGVRSWATTKSDTSNAPIMGGGMSSTEAAALANGSMIRYLDWNDTYLSREPGHPSDNFGAILSVAGAEHATGKDVILASLLAYELQCRLCDAASLREHGFDHVNYGLISATAGVGKLMGLSQTELAHAINIAINGHIALRQARAGQLSPWKGMAFGNVSRNAIVAAELAREGITGPAPIFEGRFGFYNQVAGEFTFKPRSWSEDSFKIHETLIKYYPVEYHAQAPVNCVFEMMETHDITAADVTRIENETSEAGLSIIAGEEEKWRPSTRETADHSMPYCIARAFLDGEMTLAQFTGEKIMSPEVRELMDRIEVTENPEFTEAYGDHFGHRMTVHTNQESVTHEILYPKGHYENPLTTDELTEKFRVCTRDHLDDSAREAVLDCVYDLPSIDDVKQLFTLLS